MKKQNLKIVLLILPILLLSCFGMNSILKMPVNHVDLSEVSDGKYISEFKKSRWNYTLEIEVKLHEIKSVEIIKCPFQNSEKTIEFNQKLINRLIQKQSVVIDAVSGATVSSKTFQKAAENTLKKGIK